MQESAGILPLLQRVYENVVPGWGERTRIERSTEGDKSKP